MKITIISIFLVAFLTFANCSKRNSSITVHSRPHTRQRFRARVVGGTPCPIESQPYVLSIRYTLNNTHRCAATIISSRWALTAAQCAVKNYVPGALTAYAGIASFDTKTLCSKTVQSSVILRNFIYYNYSLLTPYNVALMQLGERITESYNVRYVRLAKFLDNMGSDLSEVCKPGVVVTWGIPYRRPGTRSRIAASRRGPILQCLNLSVITNNYCSHLVGLVVPQTRICTYQNEEHECQEDFGGPLMCHGVQYGIASPGRKCIYKKVPAVYMRVDMFEEFISATIRKNAGSNCFQQYFRDTAYLFGIFLIFTVIYNKTFTAYNLCYE